MTGVEAILTRLGWETAIEHQGEVHRVKAVVQPIHDRSKLYLEADYSAWGSWKKAMPSTMGQPSPTPSRGTLSALGRNIIL